MDCGPFVKAVGKMLQHYLAEGIDIFKSSFSVSGVAKIQMLQRCEKEALFCLFPRRHADLYHTSKFNITAADAMTLICSSPDVEPKFEHLRRL